MTDGNANFAFNPDLGIDAELAGMELAGRTVGVFSDLVTEQGGSPLSDDEKVAIHNLFAPGFAHFCSLAEQAGELAGQGDFVGAFSLMGGVDNARELIGDEAVEVMLDEIAKSADETFEPKNFE